MGFNSTQQEKITKVKKYSRIIVDTKVVKVPFRKLKHIHHISDIQIRNLKRHTEYEEVFNRLYEKVKENKDNGSRYIGGDIATLKLICPTIVDHQGYLKIYLI